MKWGAPKASSWQSATSGREAASGWSFVDEVADADVVGADEEDHDEGRGVEEEAL